MMDRFTQTLAAGASTRPLAMAATTGKPVLNIHTPVARAVSADIACAPEMFRDNRVARDARPASQTPTPGIARAAQKRAT